MEFFERTWYRKYYKVINIFIVKKGEKLIREFLAAELFMFSVYTEYTPPIKSH